MRFGHVPSAIREALAAIENDYTLGDLHRKAVLIGSLDEFQDLLRDRLA